MKKISKKIFPIFVIVAMVLYNFLPFIPMTIVHAEPNGNQITLHLDGLDSISGNVVSFDVGGILVSATVSGTGVVVGDNKIQISESEINTLVLAFDVNYNRDTMTLELHNGQQVPVNGDNEATFGTLDFSGDNSPHLQIFSNGNNPIGGNNTRDYQGNTTATLNYSVTGAVEYDTDSLEWLGINFSINGINYKPNDNKVNYTEDTAYERDEYGQVIIGDNNQPIPILDPETMNPMTEKTGVTITNDTIKYDSDSDKVEFIFMMNPGTLMTGLSINNQVINDLPSTREELEACYVDHRLEIVVSNIDKADTYNIEIEARYPNADEEFMGNFLWDYNPQGYTSPEDKILNATLTFVEAKYDGHTFIPEDEVNALGGVYIWRDAPRKENYTDDREGVGEAQFPVGTELTVRIIPDAGYQLVDFGINGGVFEPQEEIGTYKFTVEGGPFHLQATIRKVDDVVNTDAESISNGNIVLGEEEAMAVGSARLDVKDIDLTDEQISNFEDAAGGYEIDNYIDISLYNIVYKGTANQTWNRQVRDLDNDATITLQLEDGVDGNDVVIVHEKHDGTYEIIPVTYNKENNTITFKTKSFSNYAIASRTVEEVANPKTGDNIIYYLSMLILSSLTLTGIIVSLEKRKKLVAIK